MSHENVLTRILESGVLGLLALGIGLLLLVAALSWLGSERRSRAVFAVLLLLSLTPMLLGVLGTVLANLQVDEVLALSPGAADPAQIAEARAAASFSTLLGLAAGAPALVLAVVGLVLGGPRPPFAAARRGAG